FGDRGWVRFAEQVVRVLARALAGGALRRLDLCRRGRFFFGNPGGGEKGPARGAERREGLPPPGERAPPRTPVRADPPTLPLPSPLAIIGHAGGQTLPEAVTR